LCRHLQLSTYGLRAIADAIQDVASAIAPELQPKTPQMTLVSDHAASLSLVG
jgi:hypothetical protein